jgi:adenylate cyclase
VTGVGRRAWIACDEHGVEKPVLIAFLLANAAGAVLSFTSGQLANPPARGAAGDMRYFHVFLAYLAVGGLVGHAIAHRIFRGACRWLVEQRQPTEEERRAVLAVPWRHAVLSFGMWLGAAAVFGVLNARWESNVITGERTALSIVLAGLAACAATYLLIERCMRPVYVHALMADELDHRHAMFGIRPRLLLSWAFGSAVPLLLVGVEHVGRPRGFELPPASLVFLISTGVLTGGLVIYAAARSVADPIDAVRDALMRVRADDLDVEVAVDDGGEIGLLQSGFNRMVEGLRERQTLQDLFGRHVGPGVARQALEKGVALGGERREVSVLFVDIVASTGLAESRPPDEVVTVLNVFFDAVVRRVGAEGGWVNKFEGDGAMCVFGAPEPQADHANRALRAARTLRRDLLALAVTHPGLDAAVGVSSGIVVAGNVGTEQRYEYTVIGDPVNEAARLTEEAKRRLGRVLASDESVERASGEAVRWRVVDEISLRGRQRPTLAYEPGPDTTTSASTASASTESAVTRSASDARSPE